jgi:hypothetical protein
MSLSVRPLVCLSVCACDYLFVVFMLIKMALSNEYFSSVIHSFTKIKLMLPDTIVHIVIHPRTDDRGIKISLCINSARVHKRKAALRGVGQRRI